MNCVIPWGGGGWGIEQGDLWKKGKVKLNRRKAIRPVGQTFLHTPGPTTLQTSIGLTKKSVCFPFS